MERMHDNRIGLLGLVGFLAGIGIIFLFVELRYSRPARKKETEERRVREQDRRAEEQERRIEELEQKRRIRELEQEQRIEELERKLGELEDRDDER